MNDLPYRYKIVFEVVVEGDGQHVGGNGAMETRKRLLELLEGAQRVVEVGTPSMPDYMPERVGTYGGLPVVPDESIPDGPPWVIGRREPRRWVIRKAATLDDQPVDTPHASIIGANTEAVRVVEEAAYAELEEMYDVLLTAVPWAEINEKLKRGVDG